MRRKPKARREAGIRGALARLLRDERGQAMTEYLMVLLAVIMLNELSGIVAGLRVFSFPDWENSFVGQAILTFYAGIVRLASSPCP